jgi:small subunit ribosomal protein S5
MVDGTLPHDIIANFKSTTVMIHPANKGTGIIAGGAIRKLVFVSGLKDVIIKRFGGNNPVTNVRAAIKALGLLKNTSSPFLKTKSAKLETEVTTV